ncbi:hypothetical protein, partial [Neisseria sicca]|uniref:hypothetical protein n=1 Tax=Neisseria sicca TaxID=490 RepID=UPI001C992A6C
DGKEEMLGGNDQGALGFEDLVEGLGGEGVGVEVEVVVGGDVGGGGLLVGFVVWVEFGGEGVVMGDAFLDCALEGVGLGEKLG